MPVYVVVVTKLTDEVTAKIEEMPEAYRLRLKDDTWLLDYDGTTRALAESISIRGVSEEGATGIAFPISDFSGRAARSTWDWLKLHMAADGL